MICTYLRRVSQIVLCIYTMSCTETAHQLFVIFYLRHIQSDEFKQEYASNKVFIEVDFSEEPDVLITDLLAKCESWCEEKGATLIVRINNELVSFVK